VAHGVHVSPYSSCMDLELEEGHTWHIACLYLISFLILETLLGGNTYGRFYFL
jgi:hypothetical protein